jgi:hypothetical protein
MKGKAIPVTGRESPYVCETSSLPHFLDNRLTETVGLSALRASHFLPPPPPPGRLLVLISVKG